MIKSEFKVTATTEAIRRSMAVLEDMTPIFNDVREYMINATRQRFLAGTAPDGSKWAPKRESTLDHYRKLGYGGLQRLKPLVGPGLRLSREITGEGDKLFSEANRAGMVIGSMLKYSRVMQDGAEKGAFGTDRRGRPIPWGRIPARTWLGISQADEKAIVQIAEEHVAARLEQTDGDG